MTGIMISVLLTVLFLLDLLKIIDLTGRLFRIPVLLLFPHIALLLFLPCFAAPGLPGLTAVNFAGKTGIILFYFYLLVRFHLFPMRRDQSGNFRTKVLYGGKILIELGLWGSVIQFVFYGLYLFHKLPFLQLFLQNDMILMIADAILTILFLSLIILNGMLRIFCTCKRLRVVTRLLVFLFIWWPIVNLFLMKYLCRVAEEEYDLECCRFEAACIRSGSQVCSLRYPLILVHGIGFRDMRYFNYWGRIPKILCRNGAAVYYGHQEAWGTIERNAECIRRKIEEVLAESHCDKVNIIAHSKGGLDARYVISALHMQEHVASLTTISTPHRGSGLIDVLNTLPDGVYRLIASRIDRFFSKFGDEDPDCYHSSKQLSPSFCHAFNEKYPNAPKVYYQSYASVMKRPLSDRLLSIPYCIMRLHGKEENDGLVAVSSARWGNFRGIFHSAGKRGISHGDMIDLKREDYKGFDVLEIYIRIVAELKEKGF